MSESRFSPQQKEFLKNLFDTFTQISSRYKWQFIATIAFLSLSFLVLLLEPSEFTLQEKITNFFLIFTNRPIKGMSFEETPLSSIIAAIAPAFLVGVLLTAAVRFFRDLTGSEFGDIRSWNTARAKKNAFNGHIIVVGLGRVGLNLTHMLYNAGYDVVGIDAEPSKTIHLPVENKTVGWVIYSKFATEGIGDLEEKVPAVWARGDDLHALEKARVSRAHAVCLMAPNFDSNLFMLMAIRNNYPHLSIITRVQDDAEAQVLAYGGIDRLVEPKFDGACEIANLLKAANPNLVKVSGIIEVADYMDLLAELKQKGFKLIRTWRWQGVSKDCTVKMLIEAPSHEIAVDLFPASFQIESATVSLMKQKR
ncbi:MAG: potassium channel family protein [Candidatus Hodarchaeales archaeon]|jgi:Trk K+ transport system NAD-binding subunit